MNLPLLLASPEMAILCKWTGLLALGWAAHWALRRQHARWRLILWRGIFCFGLALPLAHFWQMPGLKIPIAGEAVGRTEFAGSVSPVVAANPIQPAEFMGQLPETPAEANSASRSADSAQVLPAPKPIPWESILLLTWALGCGWGVFRLLRLHLRLFRLRKETCRPSPDLQQLAKEIQVRLHARREVQIQVSDAVTSPFLCGLFRPAIILPPGLARQLSPGEMRALLSHEIAHLRQNDLVWCVAWRWMKAVCWFHPLVWKVPAVHNLACEQEADRIASGQLAEQDTYSQLLARLALRVLALPDLETKLTLNGSSQIARRLIHLGQKGRDAWSWRRSVAGVGLVGLLFLMSAGFDFSRASSAEQPLQQMRSAGPITYQWQGSGQVSPPADPNVPAEMASRNESGLQLTIELRDGSRLVGKCLEDTLSFHSAVLGDIKYPWAGIRSIECPGAGTGTARLTAKNGDKFTIQFAAESLRVETGFGETELPVKLIRRITLPPAGSASLINVEFNGGGVPLKVGFAATGATPNDLWNWYTDSRPDGIFSSGVLTNLKFADGSASEVGLAVTNAYGAHGNGASDLMYLGYLYPNPTGGDIRMTITNLSAGWYDFYLYGHGDQNDQNSVFQLLVGGLSLGSKATRSGAGWNSPVWQAGVQYVKFPNVFVADGQTVTILVKPGTSMYACLGGLQIQAAGVGSLDETAGAGSLEALITDGLVGWWKLDDGSGTVAKDSSPNHHDGHLVGGMTQRTQIFPETLVPRMAPQRQADEQGVPPTLLPRILPGGMGRGQVFVDPGQMVGQFRPATSLPVWTQGKKGGALQFTGAGQYVSLGNILEDSYTELTIACWIKHPLGSWQVLVERGVWDSPDGIGLMMDHSGALVDFGHYAAQIGSKASVQDDHWHHVVGTLSRQGAEFLYSIYVDGKLDDTATHPEGLAASSDGWAIGARYNGSFSYQGLIQDVRIYDRALKAEEVRSLYEERN
jgi:beta-lactamase regulating signal transducer with metallopeptidase domain